MKDNAFIEDPEYWNDFESSDEWEWIDPEDLDSANLFYRYFIELYQDELLKKYESCSLGILSKAKNLTEKLIMKELPITFKPNKQLTYNQLLASIRHNYTNYEKLLEMLPSCYEYDGNCPYGGSKLDECPLAKEAHDIIKYAAKDAAKKLYQDWLTHNR